MASAKLLVSVNSSPLTSGGVVVQHGDVIAFTAESKVGWKSPPARWEFIDYPDGWTVPSGWTDDDGTYVYVGNGDPPDVTLPALPYWGKFSMRLQAAGEVDTSTILEIVSPSGFHDIARGEANQFETNWSVVQKQNLRTMETAIAGVGSGASIRARLVATANLDLAGAETIDGVGTADSDIVLATEQTASEENGPYTVNHSGAWARAAGATLAEQFPGMIVAVTQGDDHGDTNWQCTTNGPIDLDTDALTFVDIPDRTDKRKIDLHLVSVVDYGWTGDGVADDTASLQDAHDALASTGGTILIPNGTTLISSVVFDRPVRLDVGRGEIRSDNTDAVLIATTRNLVIRGQSQEQTKIRPKAGGTAISMNGTWGDSSEGAPAVHLSHFTFQGGARHVDASSCAGFYEGDFHAEHVTFNLSTGIAVEFADSVYYGRFTRCQWVQCYTWAKIGGYCETKFTHCVLKQSSTGGPGLHLHGAHHTEMQFCQLYGYAPNVNPDILIEPTINQTQGYLEIHRVKFGPEREYWHRQHPRIKVENTNSGEEHFGTVAVRVRFCEFLGPPSLLLTSIGRATNVATATVSSPNSTSGHGLQVGDYFNVIACTDASFCGRFQVTAIGAPGVSQTVSWSSTGGDLGQSDRSGLISTAMNAAVEFASPPADWVFDSNTFQNYAYAVDDDFVEKATARDLSGRNVWMPSNRVIGNVGMAAQEFKIGGHAFTYALTGPTSPTEPFTHVSRKTETSELRNRLSSNSEDLSGWGGNIGITATYSQTDRFGGSTASKIARTAAAAIWSGPDGSGGFTLTEGMTTGFSQTGLGTIGYLKFWAKAGTTNVLAMRIQDGSGFGQFACNATLGSSWKFYKFPIVWNSGVGAMALQFAPGGIDAQLGYCYIDEIQIDDQDGDYIPVTASAVVNTNAGMRIVQDLLGVDADFSGTIAADTIAEHTAAAGVTIDGVKLKDSEPYCDVINEKSAAAGVTIDGVKLKDSQPYCDVINEKSADTGVTVDGVLCKDSIVTASLKAGGGTPTVADASGDVPNTIGTGGTFTKATGCKDMAGTILINTGTTPGPYAIFRVSFSGALPGNKPAVTLELENSTANWSGGVLLGLSTAQLSFVGNSFFDVYVRNLKYDGADVVGVNFTGSTSDAYRINYRVELT